METHKTSGIAAALPAFKVRYKYIHLAKKRQHTIERVERISTWLTPHTISNFLHHVDKAKTLIGLPKVSNTVQFYYKSRYLRNCIYLNLRRFLLMQKPCNQPHTIKSRLSS